MPARLADSAFLRREIADRMHERLSMIRVEPQFVLDAGCGEGADLPLLRNRFPKAGVVALDAAPAMLFEAKAATGKNGMSLTSAVCGNFAALPFAPNRFDLLWSNLSLHWHPDSLQVFTEWKRVLGQDGMLMFSCFGPETLRLLRDAFQEVDRYPHVLPFVEMHDLGDSLVAAGFPSPVLDREIITVTYSSAARLLADVRALGGNALFERRRGLMGREGYRRLLGYLERQKDGGGKISLPFEIIYGHAFCTVKQPEGRCGLPMRFHSP